MSCRRLTTFVRLPSRPRSEEVPLVNRPGFRAYSERLDRQAENIAVLPGGAASKLAPGARCSYLEELGDDVTMHCLTVVALSVGGRPFCKEHAAKYLRLMDWSVS